MATMSSVVGEAARDPLEKAGLTENHAHVRRRIVCEETRSNPLIFRN